jgi:hypothetical protein
MLQNLEGGNISDILDEFEDIGANKKKAEKKVKKVINN